MYDGARADRSREAYKRCRKRASISRRFSRRTSTKMKSLVLFFAAVLALSSAQNQSEPVSAGRALDYGTAMLMQFMNESKSLSALTSVSLAALQCALTQRGVPAALGWVAAR